MKRGQRLAIEREPEVRPRVQRPMPAPPGVSCEPHRARMGIDVQAHIIINGEGFCEACSRGQGPILDTQFFPKLVRA
jgi:hypothetical protein